MIISVNIIDSNRSNASCNASTHRITPPRLRPSFAGKTVLTLVLRPVLATWFKLKIPGWAEEDGPY